MTKTETIICPHCSTNGKRKVVTDQVNIADLHGADAYCLG